MRYWRPRSCGSDPPNHQHFLNDEKNQIISQLGLFIDEDNIIHCEKRLHHSSVPEAAKQPVLLPVKHHLTELIIEERHVTVHHNGIRETLNCVREKYWIPRGRESVKHTLKQCVTCVSTRAVHLELTQNLSVHAFLQAFQHFASCRGLPVRLMSDNAKTFKSAAKEVKAITRSNKVQRYLATKGVTWKFIIAKAPWHSGFWERLIQSTKRYLKKSLGRTSLDFEELRTLLVEIAGTLTYVYDNEEGISYPLTPSLLISSRQIASSPSDRQFEILSTNNSLSRRELCTTSASWTNSQSSGERNTFWVFEKH